MIEGLLGYKLGMTRVFREDGTVVPVTVIQAGPCWVVQVRTPERDGYSAVQLGFDTKKRVNKPMRGHLKGLGNLRHLREFKLLDGAERVTVGQRVDVTLFKPGDLVDVTGTSKGRGFAGVVKRHGFAGGPKTHGQSNRWRAPGSIGANTDPGRVIKGLRMAGHMGHQRVTVQNLEVIRVDPERNLLFVKGAVPGPRKGLLLIRHAVKARRGD
ncbi:MAG: 50S ribosomal protein L3 [Chloroflexota bacterium]